MTKKPDSGDAVRYGANGVVQSRQTSLFPIQSLWVLRLYQTDLSQIKSRINRYNLSLLVQSIMYVCVYGFIIWLTLKFLQFKHVFALKKECSTLWYRLGACAIYWLYVYAIWAYVSVNCSIFFFKGPYFKSRSSQSNCVKNLTIYYGRILN